MPTFRVFLERTSSTCRPFGLYDTFVSVSNEEWAAGEHLRIASRRAATLGYGGPHAVREVRRVDTAAIREQHDPAVHAGDPPTQEGERQVARLAQLIEQAEFESARGLTEDTEQQRAHSASRRALTRRCRAPVG